MTAPRGTGLPAGSAPLRSRLRSCSIALLSCAVGLAQLPPPQAATPRDDSQTKKGKSASSVPARETLHVDMLVTDFQNRPVRDLIAADFKVETDGKPQKVTECRYVEPRPVRVAILVDDLSLPVEHLNSVKSGIRLFLEQLPPAHEAVILRTGAGEGTLEQFTSAKEALLGALDRITYNPLQSDAAPAVFQSGTEGALYRILDGLGSVAGRKAVLLFSERLRDPKRLQSSRTGLLRSAASRGSAVVYAFDAAAVAGQDLALNQGIAELAEESGGKLFGPTVDPFQALERVAAEQAGYYLLGITAEGLSWDYLEGRPRVDRLTVKARKDLIVRARRGPLPPVPEADDEGYRTSGSVFQQAHSTAFAATGMRVRLTAIAGFGSPASLDAIVHVDLHDVTFAKTSDNLYRAELQTSAAIFDAKSSSVQDTSRGVRLQLSEASYRIALSSGIDYKLSLAVPIADVYQLQISVKDEHSSRQGAAYQVLRMPDAAGGRIALSSIVLAEEGKKAAEPVDGLRLTEPNAVPRRFQPGRRVVYGYLVYNLHQTQDKHGQFEMTSQLLREGVPIYSSKPALIEIDLSQSAKGSPAGGTILLSQATPPGNYVMRLTITDKLAPTASATQFIDFQVLP